MPYQVAIVGTGIMGRRMLAQFERHQEFVPAWAWDQNPAAREVAAREFPRLEFANDVFDRPADLVYVATPPATHVALVRQATGAVLCEKPLAVDVAEARALVEQIQVPNAVNFPFATDPVVSTVESARSAGRLGEVVRVDIRLHFNHWPRKWQKAAGTWLARPEQGGFLREVFSHFAYLTDRLLGPLELVSAEVERGPIGVETAVRARLRADGVPVLLTGDVGGCAPDFNEWTLYASRASYRLQDWRRLLVGSDDVWRDVPPDEPTHGSSDPQLDAVAAMLAGQAHPLPTFADALRVQEIVEGILDAPQPA